MILFYFHKQILTSTPITIVSPFLSYIVCTPVMLGFEKHFSFHLGPIRIPPLFPLPLAPFTLQETEDGTIELYCLTFCFPKLLLLRLVCHRVLQISRVLVCFPMFLGRSVIDRLNIPFGSLDLSLLFGILSGSLGSTSRSWHCSLNPTTSPTSFPLTVSITSLNTEWFHVPASIGYSSPFVSLSPLSVTRLQDGCPPVLCSLSNAERKPMSSIHYFQTRASALINTCTERGRLVLVPVVSKSCKAMWKVEL